MNWFFEFRKIIKNGSVFFVSSSIVSVLAYGFHLLAARFLSVSEYGSLQTLISLENLILVPIVILTTLITRIMAEHKKSQAEEKSFLFQKTLRRWIFFPGILILPVLFLTIPFLKSFFNIDSTWSFVILWLSLYLALFLSVDNGFLNGWHRFFEFNLGSLASGAVKFVGGLFLIWIGWGFFGGFMGVFFGLTANIFLSGYFVFSRFRSGKRMEIENKEREKAFSLDWRKIAIVFRNAYPAMMGIVAITVFSNVDALIAKHHLGEIEAGKYGALFVLSKIIFFAVSSLAVLVVPLVAAEKEERKKRFYFFGIMLATFLGAGMGVIIFYFFPEWIVGLLFGERYLGIAQYLARFGILALLLSLLNIFVQYFISLRYKAILVVITGFSLVEAIFLWLLAVDFNQFFWIIGLSLLAANGASALCLGRGRR